MRKTQYIASSGIKLWVGETVFIKTLQVQWSRDFQKEYFSHEIDVWEEYTLTFYILTRAWSDTSLSFTVS